jgi:SAM-dependent methyltransferase
MDSQLHRPAAPPGLPAGAVSDVVEETVVVGGRPLRLLRPRDGDAVLDELLAEDDPDEDRLPFWTQLWPSGTALAGVTAARAGATVTVVDRSPEAIAFATLNAERNGVTLQAAVRAFDQPRRLLAEAPWDLVLAADVLYEQRNVPVLLWLLPRLVAQDGEVWLADPGRPMLSRFLAGAEATGWRRAQVAAGPDRVTINRLRRAGTRRP